MIWRATSLASSVEMPGPHRSSPVPGARLRADDGSPGARARASARRARSTRIETYSPAAIEKAPPKSPARPASRTTPAGGLAPESPRIKEMFVTSPSLMPNTAARTFLLDVAVVVLLSRPFGETVGLAPGTENPDEPSGETGGPRAYRWDAAGARGRSDDRTTYLFGAPGRPARKPVPNSGSPRGAERSLAAREHGRGWRLRMATLAPVATRLH